MRKPVFSHTKIGWETDHRSAWISKEQDYLCSGAPPIRRGVCLTTATYSDQPLFVGHEDTDKGHVLKKKEADVTPQPKKN